MSGPTLGRLEKIPLRSVWLNEATSFTPWLAQPENLLLLGQSIGFELSLVAKEQSVGPFRADLLCKDALTDEWVLIENQIERTDHGHLGQLITYAAGLSAVSIVWIAQMFTDEHRAALDWLNEVTTESVSFFGLEVELWRIGDSQPAPKFNVVSQPNLFVKRQVAERSRNGTSDAFYREYWEACSEHLLLNSSQFGARRSAGNWIGWPSSKSNIIYAAVLSRPRRRLTARIALLSSSAKTNYALLREHQAAIDAALPGLDWQEKPGMVESNINLYLDELDLDSREDWQRQHEWLQMHLELLSKVFGPFISNLGSSVPE